MTSVRFSCPVCMGHLTVEERTYRCENRHAFDIAREGYVNLLLANQMRSKNPGDSREMLTARRRFLQAGYYDSLAEFLDEKVSTIVAARRDSSAALLDIGCGEGFFLACLNSFCQEHDLSLECYGTDIAKIAIKMAAKADPGIRFAVAGSFKLPVLSDSMDIILRMFAPGDHAEVIRCLKKDGVLITVTPGPKHLLGLKEHVYEKAKLHDDETAVLDGLEMVDHQALNWQLDIDNQADLHDLLTMTPLYWNGDRQVKEQLNAMTALKTDVDFRITLYQKK